MSTKFVKRCAATVMALSPAIAGAGIAAPAQEGATVMSTSAYRWVGDSILQGPFKTYADGPHHIISDYSAVPGYFMPIDKEWRLKNDISSYPKLTTSNTLHTAIFNME